MSCSREPGGGLNFGTPVRRSWEASREREAREEGDMLPAQACPEAGRVTRAVLGGEHPTHSHVHAGSGRQRRQRGLREDQTP